MALEPFLSFLSATKIDFDAIIGGALADIDQWRQTATRYNNSIIGERYIVTDSVDRVLGRTQVDGVPVIDLKLPTPDLQGVAFMTIRSAHEAIEQLTAEWPDCAPFMAKDFSVFANEQIDKLNKLVERLMQPAQPAYMPTFDKTFDDQTEQPDDSPAP